MIDVNDVYLVDYAHYRRMFPTINSLIKVYMRDLNGRYTSHTLAKFFKTKLAPEGRRFHLHPIETSDVVGVRYQFYFLAIPKAEIEFFPNDDNSYSIKSSGIQFVGTRYIAERESEALRLKAKHILTMGNMMPYMLSRGFDKSLQEELYQSAIDEGDLRPLEEILHSDDYFFNQFCSILNEQRHYLHFPSSQGASVNLEVNQDLGTELDTIKYRLEHYAREVIGRIKNIEGFDCSVSEETLALFKREILQRYINICEQLTTNAASAS